MTNNQKLSGIKSMKSKLLVTMLGILVLLEVNAEPIKLQSANRIESWEYFIGGKGSYDQLDKNNEKLPDQLKALKYFIGSFDLAKMEVNNAFDCSNDSTKSYVSSISEPGKQYAFYIHHSKNSEDQQGKYKDKITFKIPKGTYRADWVNPLTGNVIRAEYFSVKKVKHLLATPEYSVDIALRIIRIL